MDKFVDKACKAIEFLIAIGLAIMVVLVFGNVVLRYGFNSGITVSEELSRWLFIWCTFLGAVVALREHGHLGVDLVVGRLPVIGKKICLIVGHVLMIFIVVLLARGCWEQVKINWDSSAPSTGWSMAIGYLPGLVFAVLAGVLLLLDFWKIVTGRLSDDELVMVQESEEAAQIKQVLSDANQASQASGPAGAKP